MWIEMLGSSDIYGIDQLYKHLECITQSFEYNFCIPSPSFTYTQMQATR